MHHFDCRRELSSVGPAVVENITAVTPLRRSAVVCSTIKKTARSARMGPGVWRQRCTSSAHGPGKHVWRPLAAARELGWAVLEKCDLARHSRVALPAPILSSTHMDRCL